MEYECDYSELMKEKYSGVKDRPHMPMAERAKIFLPFAALKGYEEAIAEKQALNVLESEPKYSI